jgi:hypothetical protein
MNITDIKRIFFDVELELCLFQRTIYNIRYWERIRFNVFQEILNKIDFQSTGHQKYQRDFRWFAQKASFLLRNSIFRNPFFNNKSDVLFWGHPRRVQQPDGFWSDVYCDPLIDEIKNKFLYIEPFYGSLHLEPIKTQNVSYEDFISFWGFLNKPFSKPKLNKSQIDELTFIEDRFQKEFNAKINILNRVISTVTLYRSKKPLYDLLLKKLKPKLLFITPSYGNENIIESSKESGTTVLEIQHGLISNYHMGYVFPPGQTKHSFPDYLMLFGDYWKNVAEFSLPSENLLVLGYPYFSQRVNSYNKFKKQKTIVFLSQGTIGKTLSKFALSICYDPKFKGKYKFIYKLHPHEIISWKQDYPWLMCDQISVIGRERNLYDILAEAEIQIGVCSTAILEGLGFGCFTYLLDLPGIEEMEELIVRGWAKVVKTIDDFNPDHDFHEIDINSVFNQNWKLNFRKILEDHLCSA